MKCSQCGYKKFEKINLLLLDGGYVDGVETYACLKCGHLELYLPNSILKRIHENINEEEKIEKYNEELEIKKEELKGKKEELIKIIKDDNSTVKAVKESKQKLSEIENELHQLTKKSNEPFGW